MSSTGFVADQPEQIFTYAAPALRFGVGARHEVAHELRSRGARRVLVVTDPNVAATGAPRRLVDELEAAGLEAVLFSDTQVEPTDASLIEAVEFARDRAPFDAIVAIGGGSSIDTAKAVNLLVTNPGDLMDYINAPVGRAQAPSQPLLPLIALPTTTGTGSESTTICVLDVLDQHVKTGISHQALRPTVAIVDPELTLTQPPQVTAAAGMDILCHALESYTARPWTSYEHKRPEQRVPYCGANPISDLWSERALSLMSGAFVQAVRDGDDLQARTQVAMAATFAGLGFGNAGVHLPHANAYPVAGQVREFRPEGYGPDGGLADHAMVPHGMAVSLTAPESFRFTFEAAPERHLRAAELLAGADGLSMTADTGGGADVLPNVLLRIMRAVGMPNGLAEVGFGHDDIDGLVEGTMKQQRLLDTAPRSITDEDAAAVLEASLDLW